MKRLHKKNAIASVVTSTLCTFPILYNVSCSRGSHFNASDDNRPVTPPPPLHAAIRNGTKETVQILLDRGHNIHQAHKSSTPLCAAIEAGNLDIVQLLLARGATAHCVGDGPALFAAIGRGDLAIFTCILDQKPILNVLRGGYSPLYFALKAIILICKFSTSF